MSHSPHILFLKSSLTCSIAIIPVVVLVYLSCTSVGFQNWVQNTWDWLAAFVLRSSELPSWVPFALAGAVYWAQCVIAKTIGHVSCRKFVYGLMSIQVVSLIALMVMAAGLMKAVEDDANVGFVFMCHFVISMMFLARNGERCFSNE